jgi:hypothetical protein
MAKIYTKTVGEVNKACIKTIEEIKVYNHDEEEAAIKFLMDQKPFFPWNKSCTREQAIGKMRVRWWIESFYNQLEMAQRLKRVTDNENCAAVVLTEKEFETIFLSIYKFKGKS